MCRAQNGTEYWKKDAVLVPDAWSDKAKPVTVRSSNGEYELRVVGQRTGKHYPEETMVPVYSILHRGKPVPGAIKTYADPTALWSPSSELLAIQSTNGGLVGNWKVYVYSMKGDRVIAHNPMRIVQRDLAKNFPAGVYPGFGQPVTTKERAKFARDTSWVNVAACAWVSNPDRLVVTAAVPASGTYGLNSGKTLMYIVDPRSGRILHRYSNAEAKREWPARATCPRLPGSRLSLIGRSTRRRYLTITGPKLGKPIRLPV